MTARSFARRKSLTILGSFAGLILLPLWLWAVRAPDGPYAPLPDYDIRKGYSGLTDLKDPRIAGEHLRLRQQRAAKRTGETQESARPAAQAGELADTFGEGVLADWGPDGALQQLSGGEQPLAAARPGADPAAVARGFLHAHQRWFGLTDAAVEALRVVRKDTPAGDDRVVVFQQTAGGLPVFQAELKVSLSADNAVLAVGGNLFADLQVVSAGKFSAAEAARHAAGYLGPLWPKPEQVHETRQPTPEWSGQAAEWATSRGEASAEFLPAVISAQAGPEQETLLTAGPFRREVRASQVVFPLSATEGRTAWQVYLMKSPVESYRVVVDAEDGALLNRTSLVKFSTPQGQVFLTNPDEGAQTLRSFVGNSTASRKTFVTDTQSGLQGNNVIMGIGANDTSGPRHFIDAFTDDYEGGGGALNNFNLNGLTLQFTPNSSGGYDFSQVAFSDALTGSNLFLTDDSFVCGPAPAGFKAFGTAVSTACVNSNGNVTAFVGDFNFAENQIDLPFGPGRLMGLWDDLNPSTGGFVGLFFTGSGNSPSSLCFRWNSVPEYFNVGSNSFSICGYGTGNPDGLPVGTIRLSYFSVSALDGMVGISPGTSVKGLPRSAGWTNFSSPTSTLGAQGLARAFRDHDDTDAAATNTFWILNELGHDRQYGFGFVPKLRNMQWKNFKLGGGGHDPVVAASGFLLDDTFFNNAFFAPNNDGVCCPFTAYGLFTAADGFRDVDSAFDSDVVVHEYGHGVSTRLANALDTIQAGAMGEGWSDWFALDYANDPVMGEYVTGNSSTGIRSVAYDASSPYHLGHFGNLFGPLCCLSDGTGAFVPEVHQDGEIWATMLSDLRTALLGGGTPPTDVSKLITKALSKTPANASMLQARDALLTAAGKLGLNRCTVWQVYADNGFGKNAANSEAPDTNLASDSFSVFQSFDRDSSCGGSFVAGTPIHSANFDSANVGDTTADGWTGADLWHVSDNRVASSPRSFYFGDEALQTYDTGFNEFGGLTSPVLDLSAATHPVLEFSLFVDAEELFPYDTLWVRLSTDGGATFPIQRAIFFWDTNGAFSNVRIDLEPLAGQNNARIQFWFDTLDPFVNGFEGVYIDSVVIRNYTEN